jgi:hypothetical protein
VRAVVQSKWQVVQRKGGRGFCTEEEGVVVKKKKDQSSDGGRNGGSRNKSDEEGAVTGMCLNVKLMNV